MVVAQFRGDIRVKGGAKYDNRYCTFFTFDTEGKITIYREYFNPLVTLAAFDDDTVPASLRKK